MTRQFLEKIQELMPQKIGRTPVVVLPMRKWREIEEALEDLEMYTSQKLRENIAKARKEKKMISLEELVKKYNP